MICCSREGQIGKRDQRKGSITYAIMINSHGRISDIVDGTTPSMIGGVMITFAMIWSSSHDMLRKR